MSDRFGIRRPPCCALAGALPQGYGPLNKAGFGKVLREKVWLRLGSLRKLALERGDDLRMQLLAAAAQ